MIARIVGLFALLAMCHGKPQMMLKNIPSPANSTFVAITNVASENQQCLPTQIKASEVCVKAGIWLFYTETNFISAAATAPMIYTRDPTDPAMSCYALPAYLDKSVGSYRLAGDLTDETRPALNVYVGLNYTANELLTIDSLDEVPYAFNSAIVTGANRWQFFMKEGFEGFSECTSVGESFIPDFQTRFGVQAGDVKSIRIDCSKPFAKLNPNHVFMGYQLNVNNKGINYY